VIRTERSYVVLLALAAALIMSGCGLPSDGHARALDPSAAPYRVLTRDHADVPPGTHRVVVFLVRDDALVPVPRRIREAPDPASVLTVLSAGPTEQEQADGLASALPPDADVRVVDRANTVVVVDLPAAPDTSNRSDAVLGYGQVVLTLTALPSVTGVRFEQDGKALQVPGADGALTDGPLSRLDYRELIDPT
jgi:spore germination protein GerM